MTAYPDTSFLCALYRQQVNSPEAAQFFAGMPEALQVSSLLLYEFRQGMRFQVFLHARDKRKGFDKAQADAALAMLQANLASGALTVVSADWGQVHAMAERLSAQYTATSGHRALDLLHVATALHLGAREFLSFDTNQRSLAEAEGLNVFP